MQNVTSVSSFIFLLLFASSCVALHPNSDATGAVCSALTAKGIAKSIASGDTQADWPAHIAAAFHVTPEQQSQSKEVDGHDYALTTYAWEAEQARLIMTTVDGSVRFLRVLFQTPATQPTLESTIHCLGAPDYYSIAYGGAPDAVFPSYLMHFYYTGQGIHLFAQAPAPRLSGNDDLAKLVQPATETTPVTAIDWVAPGSVRKIDWLVFNPGGVAAEHEKVEYLQLRTALIDLPAWPGSIDQLRVTWIDPLRLPNE